MTKDDYIKRLKNSQVVLDSVKDDFNRAISRMEENSEFSSSLAALAGCEILKMLTKEIFEIATSELEN